MMMEVRSDFVVELKLRDAKGRVTRLGSYTASSVDPEWGEMPVAIPHLHRVDPSGRWLASYDAGASRVHLLPITPEGPSRRGQRSFELRGIAGAVRQFRWLSSEDALVISTRDQVFLAPIPAAALVWDAREESRRSSEALSVRGEAVFVDPPGAPSRAVLDLRVTEHGFMARTAEDADMDPYRTQVWFGRVSDGTIQELDPLLPEGLVARAANVALDGELLVSVENYEPDRFGPEADPLDGEYSQLWSWRIPESGEPEPIRRTRCEDEDCVFTNWAPGSDPLVAARAGTELTVFDPLTASMRSWEPERSDGLGVGYLSRLWSEGGRIYASDDAELFVFDLEGELLWQWTPPSEAPIGAVHVDVDGSVLVAAGPTIHRVRDGRGRRMLRERVPHPEAREIDDEFGGEQRSFIDQALPLPGGAVAYTVVELETRYEDAWGGDAPWMRELEASPAGFDLEALVEPDPAELRESSE